VGRRVHPEKRSVVNGILSTVWTTYKNEFIFKVVSSFSSSSKICPPLTITKRIARGVATRMNPSKRKSTTISKD